MSFWFSANMHVDACMLSSKSIYCHFHLPLNWTSLDLLNTEIDQECLQSQKNASYSWVSNSVTHRYIFPTIILSFSSAIKFETSSWALEIDQEMSAPYPWVSDSVMRTPSRNVISLSVSSASARFWFTWHWGFAGSAEPTSAVVQLERTPARHQVRRGIWCFSPLNRQWYPLCPICPSLHLQTKWGLIPTILQIEILTGFLYCACWAIILQADCELHSASSLMHTDCGASNSKDRSSNFVVNNRSDQHVDAGWIHLIHSWAFPSSIDGSKR